MPFSGQSLATFAAIALLCGALSACASNVQQPTTLGQPSEATSTGYAATTPSPEPEQGAAMAPVLPAEAREQTAAGAIAFVRHYFAVVDYAYATGDTAPLAAISDPGCMACAKVKDTINTRITDGGSYQTAATRISDLRVSDTELMDAAEVLAQYSTPATVAIDSNGDTVTRFAPTSDMRASVIVLWLPAGWSTGDFADVA
jgi:hypothetical protein